MPFLYLREKSGGNNLTDYATEGGITGGAPMGDIDFTSRSILIPTRRPVKTLGGTGYTVSALDTGSLLVVNGTGAFTLLLPNPVAALQGIWVTVFNLAGQNLTVNTVSADTDVIAGFNNAAADSFSFTQASELIGASFDAVCDGTLWYILLHTEETQTVVFTG